MGLIALVIGHSLVKICGTANKMGYGNITTVDEAIDMIKGKYYHRMLAEWGFTNVEVQNGRKDDIAC